MRTYIRKLHLKPEDTRKRIFVGSLAVCMCLVGIIWISSLGYKWGKASSVKVEDEIKPFALFGQSISNTYSDITASVGNIKGIKKEESRKVEVEKQIDMIPVEIQ
jgi:hypothetical protein